MSRKIEEISWYPTHTFKNDRETESDGERERERVKGKLSIPKKVIERERVKRKLSIPLIREGKSLIRHKNKWDS